jgi:hypothetical protein
VRANAEALAAMKAEEFEARVAAVMALKGSMDEARRGLAAKNALFQIKKQQKEEVFKATFNELLEDGQNPYEVSGCNFRKKTRIWIADISKKPLLMCGHFINASHIL